MADSPFLAIPPSEWIASNEKSFAIWDSYPVSPGHVLVVTRRPVLTWFDANTQEQAAVLELVNVVKQHLDATLAPKPDGYNVGFNAGEAAGQVTIGKTVLGGGGGGFPRSLSVIDCFGAGFGYLISI